MDTTESRKRMGPPKWRQNGRQHPPKPDAIERPELGPADLAEDEMSELALAALVNCIRQPSRHNMSRVGAAKALLEYTKAKPASVTNLNHAGGLAITVSHVEAPE